MKSHRIYLAALLALFLPSAVPADERETKNAPVNVGILVLDKPYMTEFAGPLDVYHHVPEEQLRVFLVSDTDREMQTYEGMNFRARYTIDNAPKIDVLVLTSGVGSLEADLKNERVINWIRKVAQGAKLITSH